MCVTERNLRQDEEQHVSSIGVDFADKGVGSELMDILKLWFILPDNKAACRFLAVDSYNQLHTIHYY